MSPVMLTLAAIAGDIDTSVVVACIAGTAAVIGAAFSWRASTQANKVAAKKVDLEAYDRNIAYYEKLIGNLEKDLDNLRTAMNQVTRQLAQEQDVSNALRQQIRTMQAQLDLLERTLSEYRGQQPIHPPAVPGQPLREQSEGGPDA